MSILPHSRAVSSLHEGAERLVCFPFFSMQADYLLKQGLHPNDIVRGYELALAKIPAFLEESVCHSLTNLYDQQALAEGQLRNRPRQFSLCCSVIHRLSHPHGRIRNKSILVESSLTMYCSRVPEK